MNDAFLRGFIQRFFCQPNHFFRLLKFTGSNQSACFFNVRARGSFVIPVAFASFQILPCSFFRRFDVSQFWFLLQLQNTSNAPADVLFRFNLASLTQNNSFVQLPAQLFCGANNPCNYKKKTFYCKICVAVQGIASRRRSSDTLTGYEKLRSMNNIG